MKSATASTVSPSLYGRLEEHRGGRLEIREDLTETGFPGDSVGKESTCNAGDLGSIPGWEDSLEKGMATHPSILAW